jgi:two-component system response regulator (stage 0 sporulation protein F)
MGKPKILMIDDEYAILMSAKMYLDSVYEFTTETNPDKAIELLENNTFDAILQDLTLPGYDGLEVLKRIKQKTPQTPVFIVSGWANVDAKVQEALKIGAVGYITKPFDREKVKGELDKVLRKG